MKTLHSSVTRNTRETQITLALGLSGDPSLPGKPEISTPLPFLSHLLTAMAFHGGLDLALEAAGDIDVDPHHLVEDIGLVLGEALIKLQGQADPIRRYGHAVIPMDDALAETSVDVCGRPTAVLQASWPQQHCGSFDTALLSEFWKALADRGRLALHGECRRGENSHHMAEALFKSLGKALGEAYRPAGGRAGGTGGARSTKGTLTD